MTVQIAIIGLDRIGASIGMALASHTDQFYRLGNDRSSSIAREAKKIGAVDGIEANLPSMVRKSDVVILCVPGDEMTGTFDAIVQDLKDEAVVIDATAFKSADSEHIIHNLPAGRYFVSLTPSINSQYLLETSNGIDAAREDLFKNGLMIVSCPQGTVDGAIKLASDLATLLGAGVMYADPVEVGGLIAASRLLPQLAAASLILSTVRQPGWREARKLAGGEYALATAPLMSLAGELNLAIEALGNRENALRVMDDMMDALRVIREHLSAGDDRGLHSLLDEARRERQEWWDQRQRNEWEYQEKSHTTLSTSGEMMSHLLFGGLGKKARKTD